MLIWRSRLDDRYLVEVQRAGNKQANFLIFDKENDFTLIHKESVNLAYEARFGPDVDDVARWQDLAIFVIDYPDKRNIPE